MSSRRKGREAAMQFLCGLDTQGFPPPRQAEQALGEFFAIRPTEPKAAAFARSLIEGVLRDRESLDREIARLVQNFKIQRVSLVDRNILRIALYEIRHSPGVPPVVAINEAVEIGKKFGSEDSGRFLNGVLDRAAAESGRPLRESAAAEWSPGTDPILCRAAPGPAPVSPEQ